MPFAWCKIVRCTKPKILDINFVLSVVSQCPCARQAERLQPRTRRAPLAIRQRDSGIFPKKPCFCQTNPFFGHFFELSRSRSRLHPNVGHPSSSSPTQKWPKPPKTHLWAISDRREKFGLSRLNPNFGKKIIGAGSTRIFTRKGFLNIFLSARFVGSRHCAAAFSLQVPKSCTDLDPTLLAVLCYLLKHRIL